MGALLLWIGNIIAGAIAWFSGFFTKKVALAVAAVAALSSLWAGFIVAIQASINAVVITVPTWAAVGINILPSNTSALLGLILTAEIALRAFNYSRSVLALKVSA